MKIQLLSTSLLFVMALSIISCSKDDTSLDRFVTENSNVEVRAKEQESTDHPLTIEILMSGCFADNVICTVDHADLDSYGFLWTHNGDKAGHDTTTHCLCGGTVDVELRKNDDETVYIGSAELPPCTELIK